MLIQRPHDAPVSPQTNNKAKNSNLPPCYT